MNFRADPETTLSGLDARGAVPLPFAVSKEDFFSNFDYYFADPIASGCETLANAPSGFASAFLPRFLDQLQQASRAEAQFLCIFDACDLTANNGARHAPIGHWIAFRVTRG